MGLLDELRTWPEGTTEAENTREENSTGPLIRKEVENDLKMWLMEYLWRLLRGKNGNPANSVYLGGALM